MGDIVLPRGEHHYGQWMVNHYPHAIKKGRVQDYGECTRERVAYIDGFLRTYPKPPFAGECKGRSSQNRRHGLEHMTILALLVGP